MAEKKIKKGKGGFSSILRKVADSVKKEVKRTPADLKRGLVPKPSNKSGKLVLNKKGDPIRTQGVINFKPQKVKQAPTGGSETATGKSLKGGQLASGGKQKNVVGEGFGRKGSKSETTSIKKKVGTGDKKTKVTGPGEVKTNPDVKKLIAASKKRVSAAERRSIIKKLLLLGVTATAANSLIKSSGIEVGKPLTAATDPSSSGGSYKIKSGDTLSQIAKRRGTTLKALLAANPSIKNANKIRVGQTIKMSKPVKKRKSVYQGLSKSRMSKMAMPKKKKMYGGKVVKRDMGGSIGPMNNSKQDMRKERKRKMTAAAKSKYGSSYKGKVKKAIDKVINKKSARTRNETVNKAEKMIKNNPKMFSGRPNSILTEEGFEKVNRKRMGGGKVVKRGKGGSVGSNLVAGCYDT